MRRRGALIYVTATGLSVEYHEVVHARAEPRDAQNQLLALLPFDAGPSTALTFETVQLAAGSVVIEDGELANGVYFPYDCIVSLQCATRDGASVEYGLVGREGLLGVETLLESGRTRGRAIAIHSGHALRLPVSVFRELFRGHGWFRSGLLNFYLAFNTQVVQRSICHRVHTIEQQLCTWLLLLHDRSGSDDLELTHEIVGGLLGGRREGVTIAVGRLRSDGLIRSAYRRLVIVDRPALVARSCECYAVIRNHYERLIPGGHNRRETTKEVDR